MFHLLIKKIKIQPRKITLFFVLLGFLIFLTIACGCSAQTIGYKTNISNFPTNMIFKWAMNNLLADFADYKKDPKDSNLLNSYSINKNKLPWFFGDDPLDKTKNILFYVKTNAVNLYAPPDDSPTNKPVKFKKIDLKGLFTNLYAIKSNNHPDEIIIPFLGIELSFDNTGQKPINTNSFNKNITPIIIFFKFNMLPILIKDKDKIPHENRNDIFCLYRNPS